MTENTQENAIKLHRRIKELKCLYSITQLVERRNDSIEEILREIVRLIPDAWQFPESTCVMISFDGKKVNTENFKATEWVLSSKIVLKDKKVGAIDVYYLERKPQSDEGPFLKEESVLLDAIAEHVSNIIELKQAEEGLDQQKES